MTGAQTIVLRQRDGVFTVEDLSRDWVLDSAEQSLALTARGDLNRLRVAIDICSLRATGAFIADWAEVPVRVLNHLARQLSIPPQEKVPPNPRRTTTASYRQRIRNHLGFVSFSQQDASLLDEELLRHAHEGASRESLHAVARSWLHERRIVRPGATKLDRRVSSAHARAESALSAMISDALPGAVRDAIDGHLLEVSDGTTSVLFSLRRSAKSAKAKNILEQLDRLAEVEQIQLSTLALPSQATPARLAELAEQMNRYNAWELRRLVPARRYALVVAFLLTVRGRLLDESVVMTDHYITGMWNRAQKRHQLSLVKRWQDSSKATARVLRNVRQSIENGLSPDVSLTIGGAWEDAIGGEEGARDFLKIVEDAEGGQSKERHGLRDEICGAYGPLRRFLPRVMRLPLCAEPGAECLVEAIDIVRQLDEGTLKVIPEGAPYDFVPKKWRAGLMKRQRIVNRRLWETSLALAIRDGLRSGDLYIDGSKQHASFTELIYSAEQWERCRDDAYRELQIPRDPELVLNALCEQLQAAARALSRGLDDNRFVTIKSGELRLRAEKKIVEPPGTPRLRAVLHGGLPATVRLEQVLIDVDDWCHFSDAFKHAHSPHQKPSRRAAEHAHEDGGAGARF